MSGPYGVPMPFPMRRPTGLFGRFGSYIQSRSTEEQWFHGGIGCTSPTASAQTINVLKTCPVVFPRDVVIDQISFNVTAAGGVGSVSMIGVYDTEGDFSKWYPSRLLWNSLSLDTRTNTGVLKNSCIIPCEANRLYWLAFTCGTAAPTCRCATNAGAWPIGGWDHLLGTTPGNFVTVSSTYSANGMPTIYPRGGTFPSSSGPFMPILAMRFAS